MVKACFVFLGMIYLMFFIPDFFLVKTDTTRGFIFLCKLVPLIFNIVLFFKLQEDLSARSYIRWVTASELVAIVSFSVILHTYEALGFLAQVLAVVVIILGLFLLTNRWIYVVILSSVFAVVFLVLVAFRFEDLPASMFHPAIVFILLTILLSSISSYILNYFKRSEYMRSKELSVMSITDPLTGIYNRVKFDEELIRWMEFSRENKTDFSLTIFDFDDFKKVNDHFGHLVGDRVIIDTIGIVKSVLRDMDIFARWGGEEFVILFPLTDRKHAVEIVEEIRSKVESFSFPHVGRVTVSFGVACFFEDDDVNSLIHRADQLLYIAKETGKNKVLY